MHKRKRGKPERPLRLLVTGDRDWTGRKAMKAAFQLLELDYGKAVTLIHGDARGADRMAESLFIELGFEGGLLVYPAEWDKYHFGAGHIRNQLMLDHGKPDIVFAFHDDLSNSKGTKDMVKRSLNAGLIVQLYNSKGDLKVFGKERSAEDLETLLNAGS